MAVTLISSPDSSKVISASYQALFVLQSDKYGTVGITQHRFRINIQSGLLGVLGDKYTVVDNEAQKRGTFDVRNFIKASLPLSNKALTPADTFITQIATATPTESLVTTIYYFYFFEQYYDNGVFTENTVSATPDSVVFARGFSDLADKEWNYVNWFDFNGLSSFMPYSGNHVQVYPIKTDTVATGDWVNIFVTTDGNGGVTLDNFWFDRTVLGWSRAVYVPMYYPGWTDAPDMTYIQFEVSVSATQYGAKTPVQTIRINKTVSICEDPEYLIMFRDRFFQYSFMSFSKIHRVRIDTTADRGELVEEADPPGRFKYNLEAADTLILNTDFMSEAQNPLIRDLLQTEEAYLVDPDDGSLDQVVVVPSSLVLKTSRANGMVQYQMSFRKSVDNFVA